MLILALFSFSCSSDLDYNQVKDLKLEPVYILNLANFDIPANDFVDSGVEQSILVDTPNIDVLKKAFLNKNLKRVDLLFEINNTINRAYTLDLDYLDANGQPLFSTNFAVPEYSGSENKVTKTEIFENARLDLLRQTEKIVFTLKMLPGPLLDENSKGSFKFNSSATTYLIIE